MSAQKVGSGSSAEHPAPPDVDDDLPNCTICATPIVGRCALMRVTDIDTLQQVRAVLCSECWEQFKHGGAKARSIHAAMGTKLSRKNIQ
jgi:hypothetical protein